MDLLFVLATSIPAGLGLFIILVRTWQVKWAWSLLGAVLLDTFCLQVKAWLRIPRPANPAFVLPSEGPYGMPSEHAAFATFLTMHLGRRFWGQKMMLCSLVAWASTLVWLRRWAVGFTSFRTQDMPSALIPWNSYWQVGC